MSETMVLITYFKSKCFMEGHVKNSIAQKFIMRQNTSKELNGMNNE